MNNKIKDTISDLVADFTYYDRKSDEELSMDQLNETVASGEVTVDEMAAEFRNGLEAVFGVQEKKQEVKVPHPLSCPHCKEYWGININRKCHHCGKDVFEIHE